MTANLEDLKQISYFNNKLGISEKYAEEHGVKPYTEAVNLVKSYSDLMPKALYLTPETLEAATQMKEAALKDKIELQIYSGFRSYQYQHDLIKLRLDKGEKLADVLTMLTAPGYSEHHTGAAIDFTTPGCDPGSASFEVTDTYNWLIDNGGKFGFSLTYGKNNPYDIIFEPWHWSLK